MRLLPRYLLAFVFVITSSSALPSDEGMGPPRGAPGEHGPGLAHGVALSEAQERKAFALRHAAEPTMFEQGAALRKAHDALRQLASSPQFDEAQAGAAAGAIGNASAAMALNRARLDSQLAALLTPEQRAQSAQRRPMPSPR